MISESHANLLLLNNIGEYFEEFGGYLVGRIDKDISYLLILSPSDIGATKLQIKTENTKTDNTDSDWDGYNNTLAMYNELHLHPTAQFVKNITHCNFSDYYIPAIDELNLCFENCKNLFLKFMYYWSSTKRNKKRNYCQRSSDYNHDTNYFLKTDKIFSTAVRRELISND